MREKRRDPYRFLLVAFCLIGLVVALWYWQAVRKAGGEDSGERYKNAAAGAAVQFRRSIVDRAGAVLADQTASLSVCAYHINTPPLEQWCGLVASILHMQCEDIRSRFISTQGFVYLKHDISEAEAAGVKKAGIPGIDILEIMHRTYLDGPLFAHVIGFVDQKGRGLDGIEYQYDEILRNKSRTVFPVTIERGLQNLVNNVLKRQLQVFQGDSGCFVIMAIENGEILALVNIPFYDPERYWEYDRAKYPNFAISARLNPSFFPVFLQWIAQRRAALNHPERSSSSQIPAEKGKAALSDYNVTPGAWSDATFGAFRMYSPWSDAEMRSMVFQQDILNDLWGLGFGQVTGIDLPGEEAGSLPASMAGTWDAVLEQYMAATPVQTLRAFSALINRGKLVPPHVALMDSNNSVFKKISYWDGGMVTGPKAVPITEELGMRLREAFANEDGLPLVFAAPSPVRKDNNIQITALGFYPQHAPVVSYIFVMDGVQRLPDQYFKLLKPLKDVAAKAARFPLDG
ncbi:MAG: penicillin-binding transpeptidase domain-containing protein [Dissulfuribacterales bacterium]